MVTLIPTFPFWLGGGGTLPTSNVTAQIAQLILPNLIANLSPVSQQKAFEGLQYLVKDFKWPMKDFNTL